MSENNLAEMVQDSSCCTTKKFCKTLDTLPLDNNKRSDNLYLAVRQCLHKVHRLSRSSMMSPLKSPRPVSSHGTSSGVLQESLVEKFCAIKAFFDRNAQKIEKTGSRRCKTTVWLASVMGSTDQGSTSDK
ncbi:uncharacterized protein LOC143216898 [Lasioglossum baleicum]|uniref:uncharacterized protein LOC143216898 n=1 Tax=Lasioglossum baleicum TaxID=434251 RepID=UPI003FCEE1D0